MLTDDQIDVLADALIPIYQNLELDVINDIAMRVQKSLMITGTVENEIESLRKQGFSIVQIKNAVLKKINADKNMKRTIATNTAEYRKDVDRFFKDAQKKANESLKETMKEAGNQATLSDKREFEKMGEQFTRTSELSKVVERMRLNAKGDLDNLTQTTGFKTMSGYTDVRKAYTTELNKALVKLSSGAFNIENCTADCVRSLSQSGLKSVEFQGKTMQMESAVRLALRTTISRLSAEVTMENAIASGQDLIEVSEHWGARTDGSGGVADHMAWQGKVYSISGKKYPLQSLKLGYKIRKLEDATGYPNDLTGLCGYNCRHRMNIFFKNSKPNKHEPEPKPKKYNTKEYTYTEANAKMRIMERNIRNLKRERDALDKLDIDTKELKAKISVKTKEYKQFCKAMDIPTKMNRCKYLE